MTDSVQQVWVIPHTLGDHAPLPALAKDGLVAVYDRREQQFGSFCAYDFLPFYPTFDECRLAMIDQLITHLAQTREMVREIAATIEHVKTIPSTPFPSDAIRQGDRQEEAVQEEASAEAAEEVKTGLVGNGSTKYLDSNINNNADPQNSSHNTELKRPRRR
jgi:hypothetical protein